MPGVGLNSTIAASSHLKRAEVVTAQHDNAAGVGPLTTTQAVTELAANRFQFATDAKTPAVGA
jgi:hypothetical protein